MASGAYYSAVGADKIVVAPGAMVGSIGVIMEFANLEKLYDWAKISRFTINTGKYKDSGAEYRSMRDDEKELFQNMINEVWGQFKAAVAEGRNLKPEEVEPYADGRVFTGDFAVKNGFADEVGTVGRAYELAADLAGIKDFGRFF
jgi:protease-4